MTSCINPGCAAATTEAVLTRTVEPGDGLEPFAFAFRYCPACRLGFVDPFPPAAALAALYRADYSYHGDAAEAALSRYAWKLRLASLRHRRRLDGAAGSGLLAALGTAAGAGIEALARRSISYSLAVPPALPRGARILNFGFGTGAWLLAMRRLGFRELYGHDLASNEENVRRLATRGVRASSRPPSEAFPEVAFDCVRLEHVFEHLPDPVGELRRLRAVLRPGGLLVMTLPSIHSWEPVAELPTSPHLAHLRLPIHLTHHSAESARGFVAAAGYEIEDVRVLEPYPFLSVLARSPR